MKRKYRSVEGGVMSAKMNANVCNWAKQPIQTEKVIEALVDLRCAA